MGNGGEGCLSRQESLPEAVWTLRSKCSSSQGKHAHARSGFIHDDQCASLQKSLVILEDTQEVLLETGGQHVLRTHLDHTWACSAGRREDRAKVQVVCEDDVSILSGPIQDRSICCPAVANPGPVNGMPTVTLEYANPVRSQVHIDKDSHVVGSGSSASSARQAA